MASSDIQNDFIVGLPQWPGLTLEVSDTTEVIREAPVLSEVVQEACKRNGIVRVITYSGDVARSIWRDRDGPNFAYQFDVPNRGENVTMGFQASCDIPCPPTCPPLTTSWLCEMVFGKVEDNSTCIIFKLKRTDIEDVISVDVGVNLLILDVGTNPLFSRASTSRYYMDPEQQIDGHLIKNFQTPEEAGYYKEKLYVKIQVHLKCYDQTLIQETM